MYKKHDIRELAEAMIVELWSFCPELMRQVCCSNPFFPESDDPLAQLDAETFKLREYALQSNGERLSVWATKAFAAISVGVPEDRVRELLPDGRADLLRLAQWGLSLASVAFEKGSPSSDGV